MDGSVSSASEGGAAGQLTSRPTHTHPRRPVALEVVSWALMRAGGGASYLDASLFFSLRERARATAGSSLTGPNTSMAALSFCSCSPMLWSFCGFGVRSLASVLRALRRPFLPGRGGGDKRSRSRSAQVRTALVWLRPRLTFPAVQRAGQSAGAPGQRPVHVPAHFLLGGRLSGASILPEAAAFGGALLRPPGWLRLHI